RLLGIQQLAVGHHRQVEVLIVILDRLDLPPGAVEVAGKGQQLEEEQPFRLIGGSGFDGLDLGLDRILEPPGFVQFVGFHRRAPGPEGFGERLSGTARGKPPGSAVTSRREQTTSRTDRTGGGKTTGIRVSPPPPSRGNTLSRPMALKSMCLRQVPSGRNRRGV